MEGNLPSQPIQIINSDKATIIEKSTSIAPILAQIEKYLLGLKLNYNKIGKKTVGDREIDEYEWQYVRDKKVKPLLNEAGVHAVLETVEANINQITSLSNINDVMVRRLARHSLDILAGDLFLNWWRYGLDPNNLPKIIGDLHTLIINGIYKAFGGGEREFHTKTTTESFIHTPNQGGGGILGRIFRNPFSKNG